MPYIFIFSPFTLLRCMLVFFFFYSSLSPFHSSLSTSSSAGPPPSLLHAHTHTHTNLDIILTFSIQTAPCVCVRSACEMWLVMWLPRTVSRWQNALRDKRCVTARCDILKGSSASSQRLGSVSKTPELFLGLITFQSSEDEARASFKTNQPTNNHGELFHNARLSVRALPHIEHSAWGWSS